MAEKMELGVNEYDVCGGVIKYCVMIIIMLCEYSKIRKSEFYDI